MKLYAVALCLNKIYFDNSFRAKACVCLYWDGYKIKSKYTKKIWLQSQNHLDSNLPLKGKYCVVQHYNTISK